MSTINNQTVENECAEILKQEYSIDASKIRNIKENKNLDLLEESDSEAEFENIDHNKYVNLNKKYVIKCKYNSKFKKWIPIELSNESAFSRKTLYEILKK